MTEGKGSIHEAVKGAVSDSDHVVITWKPLSNTEEVKNHKDPHDEQFI